MPQVRVEKVRGHVAVEEGTPVKGLWVDVGVDNEGLEEGVEEECEEEEDDDDGHLKRFCEVEKRTAARMLERIDDTPYSTKLPTKIYLYLQL
jgi:hypothetical protein